MELRNFLAEQDCPYSIKVFNISGDMLFEAPQNKGWNATERITKTIGRGQLCRAHPPQCISLLERHTDHLLQGDIPEDITEVTAVLHPFNAYDITEVSHLLSVVELGLLTEVKRALRSRTDPNFSHEGTTPLAMTLLDRPREEDEATEFLVETLLFAKALPQTDDKPNYPNLLHLAVRSSLGEDDSTSILQMLCDARAAVDHLDDHGYTPLQTAAYYGYAEMTTCLLRCAADVNLRSPLRQQMSDSMYENQRQWWYGQETSLHFASGRGHLQVAALLLEYAADVSILDAQDRNWIEVSMGPVRIFTSACSKSLGLARTNTSCSSAASFNESGGIGLS
eukprot:Skav215824  [mRNA]  locus=scaffold4622:1095:2105:- [translate_table: standard]